MGKASGSGIQRVVVLWLGVFAATAMIAPLTLGKNLLLYDFEHDTEGWENEAPTPVLPQTVHGQTHHGNGSLGFTFTFCPTNRILHCRVREGFPRDYSDREFLGFSAWIYIAAFSSGWEARMFVRTGETWKWQPGVSIKNLLPGWHCIQIRREEIDAPDCIQDMGIDIILTTQETIQTQILIDQVEAIYR